ncbi:two-component regulator propeller domain-containing protein [Mariniflexile ostreae]|uniref:histidine kinase n=1 Tax=Mariniflexile ostreae TaxID=1520892 RepID=A0ABV5FGQ7_9FLAO
MSFKKYLTFLFLCLLIGGAYGQEQKNEFKSLKFKQLSLIEGLSQSSVLCILQDTKGFLWFGTRDGLNKYDGHDFKIYRHSSQSPQSISNSFIKSLFEDEEGTLWVGTINGLNKYIPEEDRFERFKLANNEYGISNHEIWSIASAGNGHLWLGTNYGLEKFNTQTGKTIRFIAEKESSNAILNNQIRSLFLADNGDLWICNTENIDVYDAKNQNFKHYDYPQGASKERNINYVPVLYKDADNNFWLGYRNGLFLFNEECQVFEPYKIQSTGITGIHEEVRSIHQDQRGDLWIGTYVGLYILNSEKKTISHYLHDENEPNSLSQNSIYKIFEDTKGDIWLGTYAGGVNYYDRSFDLFKHFSAGSNPSKLNYKVVSSIVEDSNQNLWIGTEGGGINFLNTSTGQFTYYTHNKNNPKSLSTNNVKAMIQTREGNFWIGTHDGGLQFFNPKKKPFEFISYNNIPGDSTSLSNNRVIALFEDYENNIWIGTSGGGVNVMDVSSKTITRISDPLNTVGSLVYNISKTSDKNILILGGDKGLAKINIKTKKITSIRYKEKQEVYSPNAILCVYEDAQQNLWVATEGDGLYHYDATNKKSIRYGMTEGLPNEVIYSILPTSSKVFWLSTNRGLSRFDLNTGQFKNFDVSDGLIGDEYNYGAYLKLKNGKLMFGGTSGIDYFDPEGIVENEFIPPVSVTSISVNNKPFLPKDSDNKKIILKHNQNVFSFNFVALSYSQPNQNQYAYKLEGFDPDWNYIGNNKSATYTNLDAGDYLFRVKASNNDGLWNEAGASVEVIIKPAPWQTWWAYLIYSLMVIGVLWFIRKQTLIRIHEKNELKQERLEKERIEEINQMKLKLFTNISHDFRTPLTLIIGPLERMLSKNIGNDFVQKQHEIMHRNASVLLQLINQLLDFRKSESGKLHLNASKSNIVPFIENIKLSFEELARVREITYTFDSSDTDIQVWFDKINLKKIVFNLLSNAFKFTSDGEKISITVSTVSKKRKILNTTEYLKLVIKDSGKGIPEKNRKAIFERYYQLGEDENQRVGTGIGLALCKNLVKLHHGSIKVKSKEGEGASFTVLLPLGKQHLKDSEMVSESAEMNQDNSFYLKNPDVLMHNPLTDEPEESEVELNKSKPTLLLVEDNAEVRRFIKEIFEEKNNILEAENGEIALEIAKNKDIDLIISDVMMPIMDGVTLCDKIKSNIITSHIPVILLTAKTSEDAQKQGYALGADVYITKPFDAHILEMRVRNLLKFRKSLINKFRKDIILQPKELTVTSADEVFLQKAISLVEDNLSNSEFGVNEFINEMGTSRSVLYRKLKALTDQSLTEFIRTIKLKRAGQLIAQSQLNISEIAFDLGFNDLKHFRKSFQKLFNELPSEYRQNHGVDSESERTDN